MQASEVYGEAMRQLNEMLQDRESSSIEAYFIVSEVLQKNKSFILTYPEYEVSDDLYQKIRDIVTERLTGRPLAHILGKREFWSMELKVNEHTLIPRPDTETLVEQALVCVDRLQVSSTLRILDLGTGTGAVALALKSELKERAMIDAVDYSEEALKVAAYNSEKLNLPINLINSDWYDNIKARHQYHIIVSNPPYIAGNDPHLTKGANGGFLLLEHGYNQGGEVRNLMRDANFTQVETVKDLGYNDRVTLGCLKYKESVKS